MTPNPARVPALEMSHSITNCLLKVWPSLEVVTHEYEDARSRGRSRRLIKLEPLYWLRVLLGATPTQLALALSLFSSLPASYLFCSDGSKPRTLCTVAKLYLPELHSQLPPCSLVGGVSAAATKAAFPSPISSLQDEQCAPCSCFPNEGDLVPWGPVGWVVSH